MEQVTLNEKQVQLGNFLLNVVLLKQKVKGLYLNEKKPNPKDPKEIAE